MEEWQKSSFELSCHSKPACCNHLTSVEPLLCRVCEQLICQKCSNTTHTKHQIDTITLYQYFERTQDILNLQVDNLKRKLSKLQGDVQKTIYDLQRNKDEAMQQAIERFDLMERHLQRCRVEILNEIKFKFSQKHSLLTEQQEFLSQHLETISTSSDFVQKIKRESSYNSSSKKIDNFRTETDDNILMFKRATKLQAFVMSKQLLNHCINVKNSSARNSNLQHNCKCCNRLPLDDKQSFAFTEKLLSFCKYPSENSFIKCRQTKDFDKILDFFKSNKLCLVLSSRAISDTSLLNGEFLFNGNCAIVGKQSVVTLKTMNYSMKPAPCHFFEINTKIEDGTNSRQGTVIEDSIVSTNQIGPEINGTYEITFLLKQPGNYRLVVAIHGKEISNSPYSIVAVESNSSTILQESNEDTNLVRIKDPYTKLNQTLSFITTDRDFFLSIGSRGRKPGEFANPQDVAVSPENKVFVTDSNNSNVQIFQLKRTDNEVKSMLVKRIGSKGHGLGQLCRPTGVCLLPSTDIAVADYDNKIVNIFSVEGKYKSKIGAGKLLGPRGICLDKNDQLVVVDNKGCKILIFTLSGKLVRKFGTHGTENSQLAGPQYAVVNEQNEILVTDFYNHCVKALI